MSRIKIVVTVLLALSLIAVTPAWGQAVTAAQLRFPALLPSQPGTVNATPTITFGNVTLYYWVTARYPIGVTMPKGPAAARRTVGVAGLAGGPVTVSWQAVPGATGYDVIRTTVPNFPTAANACVNCVVSSDQSGTTFSDIGGAVVNWPTAGTVMAASSVVSLAVNNRDEDYPYLSSPGEIHLGATRSGLDYGYLFKLGGTMGPGGAAKKTYGLGLVFGREPGANVTGDSNDALIKANYSNYGTNDANFVARGLNILATNRAPGTLGMMDNLISVANRIGGTSPVVNGLTINAENFGTNATQHSVLDLSLKNEAAKATLEFGIRIRNLNNSLGTASDAVLLVPGDALANLGWVHGIDFNGAKITYDFRTHAGPVIVSGAGAPAAGDCAAGTLGSIYLSAGGGANTSFYVCQIAGGWSAVTP